MDRGENEVDIGRKRKKEPKIAHSLGKERERSARLREVKEWREE